MYNDSKGIYLMYLRKSRADEYNQDVENILKRHEKELQSLASVSLVSLFLKNIFLEK